MMKLQKEVIPSSNKSDRRRGRPAGKNRTPLSLEERRARNAQYERERRNETADAMAQLAEAACCDPHIANADLLATVISQLQRRAKRKLPEDIEDLKRINDNLESQIAELQSRLGHDVAIEISGDLSDDTLEKHIDYPLESQTHNSKIRDNRKPKKIQKKSRSSSVCDTDSETQSDSSDSSSSDSSASSETVSSEYQLRTRRSKVSEQSESTTSTYIKTESESSQYSKTVSPNLNLENTNLSDASYDSEQYEHKMKVSNDSTLTAVPEQHEYTDYTDLMETTLIGTLTDSEKEILDQWLDCTPVF